MSFGAPSFAFGSAVSATGSAFSDAFESYRRAQYLVAGSAVAPNSEVSDFDEEEEDENGDGDEEAGYRRRRFVPDTDDEEDYEGQQPIVRVQRPTDDSFVTSFDWDQEQEGVAEGNLFTPSMDFPRSPARSESWARHSRRQRIPRRDPLRVNERAPLLARKKSEPQSIQLQPEIEQVDVKSYGLNDPPYLAPSSPTLNHKTSSISQKSQKSIHYAYVGRSTYGQTLFNSIAILLGIGMLSEPLAFAYAGWTMGTIIVISYAYISCYTAKILARMILVDPRLRSYSDIGRKAFGPRATVLISGMFCLELFAVTVILVTLYGDSIHALIPTHSVNTYKLWILVVLIPTVFLPLSLLSYTSILGIVSTLLLVVVIFYDGFSKATAPGSLLDHAPTNVGVQDLNKLGIAFGLFMAGFSGHPVIPSLARDMIDPTQFDSMINWAFGIATVIYMAIGSAGYLMFGDSVHDEISVDLLVTSGFSPFINKVCLWLLVISPISKFGLNSQPLNTTIDILVGIDHNSMSSPEELATKPNDMSAIAPHGRSLLLKKAVAVVQRISITCLSVFVSISIPEFSSMMAFLGSFSAFMLAIVGPVAAKVTVERRCGVFDALVMLAGVVMAIWGTAAAFWSAS